MQEQNNIFRNKLKQQEAELNKIFERYDVVVSGLESNLRLLNDSMNTRIDGVVKRMGELTVQVDSMLKSVDSKFALLMERLDANSTNEPSAKTRLVTDIKTAEIAQQALQQSSEANQQAQVLANAVGGQQANIQQAGIILQQQHQQQQQQLQLEQHSNIITNATSGTPM